MSVRKAFKTLDAFPKVEEPYVERSGFGGLSTAVVSIALAALMVYEITNFQSIQTKYEYFIDTNHDTPLQVNMDLTVGLPCKYLATLMWDHSGAISLDIRNLVTFEDVVLDAAVLVDEAVKGQDAFGRDMMKNIRQHIRGAHKLASAIVPGLPAGSNNEQKAILQSCRVYGSFPINRVAGRLQIMAQGHGQGNVHTPHEVLNFTHRIAKLSFGQYFPGLINPLDGRAEVALANFQMYQYFLSVVPTTYVDANDNILLTNQYAVTEYNRVVDHEKGTHGIPGLMFKFDIEPLLVKVVEEKHSFFHLLTRLCGIVGGTFVCSGLVSSIVDWLVSKITATKTAPLS